MRYDVHRTFNRWTRGDVDDFDPDDDGVKALVRAGYLSPAAETPPRDPFVPPQDGPRDE